MEESLTDNEIIDSDGLAPLPTKADKKAGGNKRLSIERIYQKKTQLEHILLRPDTYIGSVEPVTQPMWVWDAEAETMTHREITFVPGLYKIFDEILVNAADNKQRDKKMDIIKVDIDPENNVISIYNNGKGIPVVEHKVEKMFVPSLIFGHLLTSSNYNDEEKKVTGGRNGYGAKLCNIFSKKFTVETSCKDSKGHFKQVWTDNMGKTADAKVKPPIGEDFTRITFTPDLSKFKMESLDKDTVALMSRRAFDIAGASHGVKVYLNGKRLPIKNFKDYVEQYTKGKEDDQGNPLKVIYENVNERWEVALAQSDRGFQQVSFVNSIATTKGGRHVDHVAEQITNKLIETVKKKNKGGINIKPFQLKSHMWVFVNCLIENPTFDSQTKENMTLQAKNFGSKCKLSDKFTQQVQKCGIVESIMTWMKFKQENQLAKQCHKTKHTKLKGIPKLEDANHAGTKNSVDCTLILTEGDSAKSLAVSGLGVVGRDKYGVFPLKGKMLNVREATHKQILENAEINNIIKIMGLQYKKKYETADDLKSLRYGRLMIMTDQDQDGSHIKGLLINFIHHNWPTLLKLPFLEEFITPIVKATKAKESKSFYSLPEFEEWKQETNNWHTWKVKYYKGLGTSTAKEAQEYFADMLRHRIIFKYTGPDDDKSIELAFSKKMVEGRKEWLTNGMEERKHRRELGLPEIYLYGKNTKAVTYQEFVNKELILFSNMDNERSIPSIVDGLKPGSRKVVYTCLKRNDKREVKVAQLAGSVAEHSAYHHGENSLMSTIINLAQNFVGSNNINLLQPIGQFGTRLQGGKDAASPRYIFTMLSPLARHILNNKDDALLNHLNEDNQIIEPEYYVPIIPMVLVNGAEGIGTGWMTKIPNYNPREIVQNMRRMIAGQEPLPLQPWFKNFRGTIDHVDGQRYAISGECALLDEKNIEITELPIRTWTQSYKESVLEPMLHGTEKTPPTITDYKEYHTDTTVRFTVTMSEQKLSQLQDEGLHKAFRIQTTISNTSMVLFDHNGCLKRYDSVDEILKEFFTLRLDYYVRRKAYMEGYLRAEADKLSNQARFILEKTEGKLVVEKKKRKEIISELARKGYDSDPMKVWKEKNRKKVAEVAAVVDSQEEIDEDDELDEDGRPAYDFNYLLGMTMWCLTKEKIDELLKQRDQKLQEYEVLKSKSPSDLWLADLDAFMEELDKVEKKEIEDENSNQQTIKGLKGMKGATKGKGGPKKNETQPSVFGERVFPVVDPEFKKKSEKQNREGGPGVKRGRKKAEVEVNSDGEVISPPKKVKTEKGEKTEKQPRKRKTPSPKKKKRNPWSTDETSGSESDMFETFNNVHDVSSSPADGKKKAAPKPKKLAPVKKSPWSDSEDSADEFGAANGKGQNSSDEKPKAKPKPKAAPKKSTAAKVAKPKTTIVLSDDEIVDDSPVEPRARSSGRAAAKPVKYNFDDDEASSAESF